MHDAITGRVVPLFPVSAHVDINAEELKASIVDSGIGDANSYTGVYNLKSSFVDQRLATKNKIMGADVTVSAMEYAEVSNTSGGLTLTIGG